MKVEWSKAWNASKQPAKQRKYRFQAPLHIKQKFMHVHLSPELREKHSRRQVMVRKGDTIKVLRGQYKGKKGTVTRVFVKLGKVYVDGIERGRRDGNTTQIPLQASNLMITALDLEDKKRKEKLTKKEKKVSKKEKK
jgi:large subunit ribosomal protein L24